MMPNKIQPQEYSKDSGTDGALHVTDSDGDLNVFNVKRNDDGKSWLNANYGNPSNFWNADNRFVFVSRRFLHSPLFIRWGFIFANPLATLRAFFLFHPNARKLRYIFYYLKFSFPRTFAGKI